MCLVFAALNLIPEYRLVIVANRDEFYGRASAPAARWQHAPQVIAGRDLEAGGSWLGVTEDGRFAALTNYRESGSVHSNPPSRGALVADFLHSRATTDEYLAGKQPDVSRYNGFNLLVDDGDTLGYCSNRAPLFQALQPGLYGLSNHLLDTPWPKVENGKQRLDMLFATGTLPDFESLFDVMTDQQIPVPERLPHTGVSPEYERVLSPAFIRSPSYGTRATTLVGLGVSGGGFLLERSYDETGQAVATVEHRF